MKYLALLILLASCAGKSKQHTCACVGYGLSGKDTGRMVITVRSGEDAELVCDQAGTSGTTPVNCFIER